MEQSILKLKELFTVNKCLVTVVVSMIKLLSNVDRHYVSFTSVAAEVGKNKVNAHSLKQIQGRLLPKGIEPNRTIENEGEKM